MRGDDNAVVQEKTRKADKASRSKQVKTAAVVPDESGDDDANPEDVDMDIAQAEPSIDALTQIGQAVATVDDLLENVKASLAALSPDSQSNVSLDKLFRMVTKRVNVDVLPSDDQEAFKRKARKLVKKHLQDDNGSSNSQATRSAATAKAKGKSKAREKPESTQSSAASVTGESSKSKPARKGARGPAATDTSAAAPSKAAATHKERSGASASSAKKSAAQKGSTASSAVATPLRRSSRRKPGSTVHGGADSADDGEDKSSSDADDDSDVDNDNDDTAGNTGSRNISRPASQRAGPASTPKTTTGDATHPQWVTDALDYFARALKVVGKDRSWIRLKGAWLSFDTMMHFGNVSAHHILCVCRLTSV